MSYTPTTEEVRAQWGYNYPDYDNTSEQFDRWLEQVKAEVWEEGYAAGDADATTGERLNRDNPYIPEIGKTPQHFPETGNNV